MIISTDFPDMTPAAARDLQKALAPKVISRDSFFEINTVAGVDVGFEQSGRIARAAVALLDFHTLALLDYKIERLPVTMPYIPGLLSFRECPVIMKALSAISETPDLLICDGQGIAHPRRFGVACHLGVLTGIPSIGVAKSRLYGHFHEPGVEKGDRSYLYDGEEVIGSVLRTRRAVKPVYVSIGHKISLNTAVHYVMACVTKYRLPETTRWADALASNRGQAMAKAEQLLGN